MTESEGVAGPTGSSNATAVNPAAAAAPPSDAPSEAPPASGDNASSGADSGDSEETSGGPPQQQQQRPESGCDGTTNTSASGGGDGDGNNAFDNLEEVLMELNQFEKRVAQQEVAPIPIPELLEDYVNLVAKTGSTFFPWPKVKPLLRAKMENVIAEFYTSSPTDDLPPVPNVDPFSFSACRG